MWLFYIDESGNTGLRLDDPDQPVHYLIAVGVHESRIRSFELALAKLASSCFPEDWQKSDFEFKGQAIRKGGKGYFKDWPPQERIGLTTMILKMLARFKAVVFESAVDKSKILSDKHPQQIAFKHLVQQIDRWLVKQPQAQCGLLVADEEQDVGQKLIDDLQDYKWLLSGFNPLGKPTKKIVDSVHFVRSNNNPLVQVADVVAFTINRGRRLSAGTTLAGAADMMLFNLLKKSIKKPTKVDYDSGSVTQTHS